MSLIQEALRRRQEERETTHPAGAATRLPPTRNHPRGWGGLLALLFGLVVVGVTAVAVTYLLVHAPPAGPSSTGDAGSGQVRVPRSIPGDSNPPPPGENTGGGPVLTGEPGAPTGMVDTVVQGDLDPVPVAMRPGTGVPVDPVEQPDPVEVEPQYPEKLVGVLMGRAGESSSVILDTEVVELGETYEGVRVLRVEGRGAELVIGSVTQYVRVGKSIPVP